MPTRPVGFWGALGRQLLGGLLLSGSLAGCSGAHEPAQQAERPPAPQAQAVTSVPALLGQPVDKLYQRLGPRVPLPPSYEDGNAYAQLSPRSTDSVRAFRVGGLLLVACYDIQSRRVHDFLLLGRHEDSLMHRGGLRTDAPGYLILPVFRAKHPGSLLGLRVVDTDFTNRN